jgi:hypothetical protein
MRNVATLLLVTALTACGGGGGGDGAQGKYGGTWRFRGIKMSDNCRSNLPPIIEVDLRIKQDDNSVTIQSGRFVATGSVNDKDGVSATATRPADNGCTDGISIVLSNASDGEAEVGYALGAQCGRVTCAVGYAGPAVRTAKAATEGDDADLLFEEMEVATQESETGVEGGILSALEETQLELETGNTPTLETPELDE